MFNPFSCTFSYLTLHSNNVFIVLLLCISCKTKYQYVEVPKETIKVEYKDKLIHDSIYNIDSVYIKEKNDTIYHFKTKIQYKYKYT